MLIMDEEIKKDPWRQRFLHSVTKHLGVEVAKSYFPSLFAESLKNVNYWESEITKWTVSNIEILNQKLEPKQCRDVLTGCTCHIMTETIEKVRKVYLETGSIDLAHEFMVEDFYRWLKSKPELTPEWLQYMRENNWGVAGRKDGNKIIATKIPADTAKYFSTDNSEQKRFHYCHCPRIKPGLNKKGNEPPVEYCFCGAGFYRAIWEGILGQSVDISISKSLLKGDAICQFEIELPKDL